MLACFDCAFQHAFTQYGESTRGAGYHDIMKRQLLGEFIQRNDLAIEAMGQGLCALTGAIGDSDALGIAGGKVARA